MDHLQFQQRRKERVLEDLASVPFSPPTALRGGNRQTLSGRFFRRGRPDAAELERWQTPDDDRLRVHIREGHPERPVAVLLHGLEGSVRSSYIVGLTRALSLRGHTVVVMEHRSCGGEMNRARRLYHLGETTDLAFVVERVVERWPGRPIVVAGYSAGGNQLAKWLGERGADVPDAVVAAAVVSAPYDLVISGPHIDGALGGLYTRNFMRTLVPKALAKARQHPGCLDEERVRACRTFVAFDTHATAPLHGYRDAWDYWARVSCGQFLEGVRRPTLLLSAEDDPFNPRETLPVRTASESPWLHAVFPKTGGHVGFVDGSPLRPRYWGEGQVVRFFDAYAKLLG